MREGKHVGRVSKIFSTDFKVDLVARLERGEPAAKLARETGVARKLLYDWLKAYRAQGAGGLNRKRGRKVGGRPPPASVDAGPSAAGSRHDLAKARTRIADLERIIAASRRICIFFAKPCGSGMDEPKRRRAHLYAVIEEMTDVEPQGFSKRPPAFSVCARFSGVSRAGYYRHFAPKPGATTPASATSS